MVGELVSHREGEPSEDAPSVLWDCLEGLWEDLGLPERPLWNIAGAGPRPAAEKVRLAALPIGLLAAAVGFVWLVVWLGAWMNDHWGVYAVVPQAVLMLVAVCGAAVERRRRWEERRSRGLRMTLPQLDAVGHQEFESVIRDLMRRDGFTAERVGRGGDDACDVRAVDSDGQIWAVQCKHRRDGWAGKATGVEVLQQVNGTAGPVHGARFAVIVTNGRFSKPAAPWAARHGIRLVDRHVLQQWADQRRPLWEVLGDVRRPRRLPGQAR
ncbi:restriction endonuclease [Streptomyces sp. B29(2018)]|uniref:restriction endonuclease n=1 Tax=Streptomyces sp. B29(2018) TaxID=2485016 RepID=UPI000FD6B388|nr:restriction endonuclease [Streptomyces sp. B29(2018)]